MTIVKNAVVHDGVTNIKLSGTHIWRSILLGGQDKTVEECRQIKIDVDAERRNVNIVTTREELGKNIQHITASTLPLRIFNSSKTASGMYNTKSSSSIFPSK